jgi:hypothetical protein
MNLWRWFGLALFAVVGVILINAVQLPVVDAQDKGAKTDKTEEKTPTKGKTEEKTKGKTEEKTTPKQTETPKAGGGEKLPFTAFDSKSKPFYQEQTTETVQNMKVQGQTVVQKQKQTS